MVRNAQKEFLIGQSSRSHATSLTISGWLLVFLSKLFIKLKRDKFLGAKVMI